MKNYLLFTSKLKLVLFEINWFKTIAINYYYVGFQKMFTFPVIIYRGTILRNLGGVKFDCKLKTALLTVGAGGIGTLDFKNERTIWDNRGVTIIKGNVYIGKGARVSVSEEGTLEIDDGFHLSGRSSIVCNHRIVFGKGLLLSWDILIMDSDLHPIINASNGEVLNKPQKIVVGNHVWIGCRGLILKGVNICDNVIIAAGALITKNIETPNCIYSCCGSHNKIIKSNVVWKEGSIATSYDDQKIRTLNINEFVQ